MHATRRNVCSGEFVLLFIRRRALLRCYCCRHGCFFMRAIAFVGERERRRCNIWVTYYAMPLPYSASCAEQRYIWVLPRERASKTASLRRAPWVEIVQESARHMQTYLKNDCLCFMLFLSYFKRLLFCCHGCLCAIWMNATKHAYAFVAEWRKMNETKEIHVCHFYNIYITMIFIYYHYHFRALLLCPSFCLYYDIYVIIIHIYVYERGEEERAKKSKEHKTCRAQREKLIKQRHACSWYIRWRKRHICLLNLFENRQLLFTRHARLASTMMRARKKHKDENAPLKRCRHNDRFICSRPPRKTKCYSLFRCLFRKTTLTSLLLCPPCHTHHCHWDMPTLFVLFVHRLCCSSETFCSFCPYCLLRREQKEHESIKSEETSSYVENMPRHKITKDENATKECSWRNVTMP